MIKFILLSIILTALALYAEKALTETKMCVIEDSILYKVVEDKKGIVVAENTDSPNIKLVIIRKSDEVEQFECSSIVH